MKIKGGIPSYANASDILGHPQKHVEDLKQGELNTFSFKINKGGTMSEC